MLGGVGEWGRPCDMHALVPKWERGIGFLHEEPTWHGKNVRLEFMVKLRLSVDAMGRSSRNISARLKAGMDGVKVGGGIGADAMEPADERRVTSIIGVRKTC
jgi:hypothetical protein